MPLRPRVLTIAGSDSGGGAGIQADLKTFCAHGVYGMSVLTAVTAQNTLGVSGVLVLEADLVGRQLDCVLSDIGVDAVKIGMLGSAKIVETVADRLSDLNDDVPIVLDPVMVAKSGDALLAESAVASVQSRLLPIATLVTPNLPEAEILSGLPVESPDDRQLAAQTIARSGAAVLLKGGHAVGQQIEDLLVTSGTIESFRHPRVDTTSTHGTGCTLSAAIAARLACGDDLRQAVEGGITYLQGAILSAPSIGSGHGPVDHLHRLTREETG